MEICERFVGKDMVAQAERIQSAIRARGEMKQHFGVEE
jgi:hypothetical protein